jgi:glycosyltransferase involved in cell wall biosynthesis
MKILLITNEYYNFFKFRYSLIYSLLSQKNCSKLSLLAKFDGYEKKFQSSKINYYNINILSRSFGLLSNINNLLNLIKNIFFIKPKIVISFTIKPNLYLCILKFFFKFKLITNITGLGEVFLNNDFKYRLLRSLFINLLTKSDLIICQNEDDVLFFISKNLKLKDKIKLIPGSGIKINKFTYNNNKKINFLFVGRIIKEKGLIEYIEAANLISEKYKKQAKFHIIGQTYKNNKFNKIFFNMLENSNSIYHGYQDNIDLFIAESDCVVLPSYREGLSKFLLEGLSFGKPLITTNVPGCKQLLNNNYNGFIVNVRDVKSLSNAFIDFIKLSHKKKYEFSINSYNLSKSYSHNRINTMYVKYINKLVK